MSFKPRFAKHMRDCNRIKYNYKKDGRALLELLEKVTKDEFYYTMDFDGAMVFYNQKLWVVNPRTMQGGYMDADIVSQFVTMDQMQESLDRDFVLDALTKEWRRIGTPNTTSGSSTKSECTQDWHHQWKEYRGFSEEYEFCLTCDKKRDRFTKKEIK